MARTGNLNQIFQPKADEIVGEANRGEWPRRDVAFGEALRAMSLFAGHNPDLASGNSVSEMLERAYRVLAARGRTFSAEDFSLYVLSLLLERIPQEDCLAFRRGAARYLLEHRGRLSGEIRALAEDARRLLGNLETASGPAIPTPHSGAPETQTNQTNDEVNLVVDEFVFDFGTSGMSTVYRLTQSLAVHPAND